jgi:recombination protein RecT
MSALEVITGDIYSAKDGFISALSGNTLSFEQEAGFAIQVLSKNDYALKIALGNRQSVVNSVINIAAIGISLNPAKKQAYLVPRKSEICLDISYMGLIDIALESGSVKWAQCKIVRANDKFILNDLDKLPTHEYKPFDKKEVRGEIVGVYIVVKTADGDYLTHDMEIDAVYDIRSRSESYKSNKGPWVSDAEEMIKKTCVKQAYKYWPKTDRLASAIHYLNTEGHEGIELEQNKPIEKKKSKLGQNGLNAAIQSIKDGTFTLEKLVNDYDISQEQLDFVNNELRTVENVSNPSE